MTRPDDGDSGNDTETDSAPSFEELQDDAVRCRDADFVAQIEIDVPRSTWEHVVEAHGPADARPDELEPSDLGVELWRHMFTETTWRIVDREQLE